MWWQKKKKDPSCIKYLIGKRDRTGNLIEKGPEWDDPSLPCLGFEWRRRMLETLCWTLAAWTWAWGVQRKKWGQRFCPCSLLQEFPFWSLGSSVCSTWAGFRKLSSFSTSLVLAFLLLGASSKVYLFFSRSRQERNWAFRHMSLVPPTQEE